MDCDGTMLEFELRRGAEYTDWIDRLQHNLFQHKPELDSGHSSDQLHCRLFDLWRAFDSKYHQHICYRERSEPIDDLHFHLESHRQCRCIIRNLGNSNNPCRFQQ